jgi:polyphenol oxidase
MSANSIIQPVVWPIVDKPGKFPGAAKVRAAFTTRLGGVSTGGFAKLNLGDHVGDAEDAVAENRKRLAKSINAKPRFLRQVHDTEVVNLDEHTGRGSTIADASVVSQPGIACVVMAADCLPVLMANVQGTVVAAAHCGWKGLSGVNHSGMGVLETTMLAARAKAATLRSKGQARQQWQDSGSLRDEWVAWLGPAIGPKHFEVGPEVYEAFVSVYPEQARAFETLPDNKYKANLFALARMRLARLGVLHIIGGGDCTYSQPEKYFSHRRSTHQATTSGRHAAMIWIDEN